MFEKKRKNELFEKLEKEVEAFKNVRKELEKKLKRVKVIENNFKIHNKGLKDMIAILSTHDNTLVTYKEDIDELENRLAYLEDIDEKEKTKHMFS